MLMVMFRSLAVAAIFVVTVWCLLALSVPAWQGGGSPETVSTRLRG